ncbi:MAG: hypothetical protein IJ752_07620 [Alphaproteobacteria bacterium]|nr:hypothetical protein [Alphaproteobacteria bacterium]
MAEEKIDQNAAEIQENPVPGETVEETDAVKTGAQAAENHGTKGSGFGKAVLVLLILAAAGLFGVPQTRTIIMEKYRTLLSALRPETNDMTAKTEETVQTLAAEEERETEEIASRLEQLENAREFENAEVIVATVEPPEPPVMADPAYIALADQQKALLAEIERLRRQLGQFKSDNEHRLNQLQEIIPDTQQLEERVLAVHAREDAMEQQLFQEGMKIDRLEKNKADASSVLALMTRMDAAEQKLRVSNAEKERAVALLLAVYQLREAAFSGHSFAVELQSALALADSSPRIAGYIRSLSGVADQGIRTKTALLRSFNVYADQAILSETLSSKTDWFHQALNSLKTLVIIRKTDASDGEVSTQAVLARAGLAVRDEDLGEAVLILKELQGKSADTMKEWIVAVERYLAVKRTVNETISAVLGVIYAEQLKGE